MFLAPFLPVLVTQFSAICGIIHGLLYEIVTQSFLIYSKKNSCYFCDFCEICYFFYTFLIAVFFKSFLLKLRKQFASKFLLTRSILDISEILGVKQGALYGLCESSELVFFGMAFRIYEVVREDCQLRSCFVCWKASYCWISGFSIWYNNLTKPINLKN